MLLPLNPLQHLVMTSSFDATSAGPAIGAGQLLQISMKGPLPGGAHRSSSQSRSLRLLFEIPDEALGHAVTLQLSREMRALDIQPVVEPILLSNAAGTGCPVVAELDFLPFRGPSPPSARRVRCGD